MYYRCTSVNPDCRVLSYQEMNVYMEMNVQIDVCAVSSTKMYGRSTQPRKQ
jgi:hypothetical protein